MRNTLWLVLLGALSACGTPAVDPHGDPSLLFPGETRIHNLRQMTFGGTTTEANWSFDGRWLTFKHRGEGLPGLTDMEADTAPECDQIFSMKADGTELRRLSNGKGRCTSSFYLPDASRVLFSSTYAAEQSCPTDPDSYHGNIWPINDSYQVYSVKPDGSDLIPFEPGAPKSYNAETSVCADGSVVFTSDRDGDLDLYTAKLDNLGTLKDVKRITHTLGYDGNAFFSRDCKKLVWSATRPRPGQESADYKKLLKQHQFRASPLELWTSDVDGSHARQITNLDSTSSAPYLTPDQQHIVFSSNYHDPHGTKFDLYQINLNGTRVEQITDSDSYDSFPVFSPDGKYLAFSSNRHGKETHETNLIIANWSEQKDLPISDDDAQPADRFQSIVEKLSSADFEGRGVTTPGLLKAEDYVVERFQKLGLTPFFEAFPILKSEGEGYRHPVEIQTGVKVDFSRTRFEISGVKILKGPENYIPAAFSGNGTFDGPVVDVGYGVNAPELGLNDYRGLDVKNKIALIRRHTPKNLKLTPDQEVSYGDLRYKAYLARERGAKAVLFWEADEALPERMEDSLKAMTEAGPTSDAGLPVLFVQRQLGHSLVEHFATGAVYLERKTQTTHNILGVLGQGCGKTQPVLIGAHLDHLGHGGEGSLEPSRSGLHPGADDNASGIAALLEVARGVQESKTLGQSCFVFAAFTGEEVGIVGSSRLVDYFKSAKVKLKAMLNMDMVGRMEGNALIVFGTGSALEWPEVIRTQCEVERLTCAGGGDGYGPSDHMPFYVSGIPVVHFFTGSHSEYHRTSDVASLINAAGGVQTARLVTAVALRAASPHQSLHFQNQKKVLAPAEQEVQGIESRMGPTSAPFDYSAVGASGGTDQDKSHGGGVKLSGVRPGSPAEKAGVRAGDLLAAIDTHEIQNLEDFTLVLESLMPDQKVTLKVRRDKMDLNLPATVGKRE